ncbi:hypothetical protein B0H19DRAFT_156660 [Mycena capillaripes]|nr:hypothetical protein B0H19DRAFT_156660 [Mycena capillaripes]
MARFSSEEDTNLIRYLSAPARLLEDPLSAKLYEELGGSESNNEWSRSRKSDGWQRRALKLHETKDLDGSILREARRAYQRAQNKKDKDQTKKVSLDPVCPQKSKGKAHKPRAAEVQYDLDDDVTRLSNRSGFSKTLVREVVDATGSVVYAAKFLADMSATRDAHRDEEMDDDTYVSSGEDEEPVEVQKKSKAAPAKMSLKRKHVALEDEEDDKEEERPPRKVKKAPATIPSKKKIAKPVSKARPKQPKYVVKQEDDSSSEDDYDHSRSASSSNVRRRT